MALCNSCLNHTRERNRAVNDDYLALVNLPKRVLRDLSTDQLATIYREAQTGAMVCGDCINLCRKGYSECRSNDLRNIKIYQSRVNEDKATMKNILEELDRRITLKENLNKFK